MDELQTELDDGPCLTAIWEQETVHIPDMATESRWPRFAAAAAQAGVGAMLCFQLFVHGDTLGALNLYSPTAGAFTEDSETIGLVFATHAAVALAAAQQEHQLTTALASRDIIGQAKGIVMERFYLDTTRAFALIARLSPHENIKLHCTTLPRRSSPTSLARLLPNAVCPRHRAGRRQTYYLHRCQRTLKTLGGVLAPPWKWQRMTETLSPTEASPSPRWRRSGSSVRGAPTRRITHAARPIHRARGARRPVQCPLRLRRPRRVLVRRRGRPRLVGRRSCA